MLSESAAKKGIWKCSTPSLGTMLISFSVTRERFSPPTALIESDMEFPARTEGGSTLIPGCTGNFRSAQAAGFVTADGNPAAAFNDSDWGRRAKNSSMISSPLQSLGGLGV